MKLSKRIESMEQSGIRKLLPFANEAESRGLNVIKLNIGQPDLETPTEFFDAIKSFKTEVLEYQYATGIIEARKVQSKYLKSKGLDFTEEELVINAGGSEAILYTFLTLCDSKDKILTVEPFYSNYGSIAKACDLNLVAVTTFIEDNFKFPKIEEFEKHIDDNTKCIVLSNPCNPTGRVYTREEMEIIIELAKKYDLTIISDEVYREFNFSGRDFVSFAEYEEILDRLVIIDSNSKKYSTCGARFGITASKNKEFINSVAKLCQIRLSVSLLDQIGSIGLENLSEEFFEKNRIIYEKRRNVLYNRLRNINGVNCVKPEGAFYSIVRLPVDDSEKFITWMLKNIDIDGYTLLLTPAKGFYKTSGLGIDEVRISYCIDEDLLNKAMDILEYALNKYPDYRG